jgi:hypothetical protein
MPPGLDDDSSRAGGLQRCVLGDEELALNDVPRWTGGVEKL